MPRVHAAWDEIYQGSGDSVCLVSDARLLHVWWSSAKPVQRAPLLQIYWAFADALAGSPGDPSFGVEPSRTPVFKDLTSAGGAPAASVV